MRSGVKNFKEFSNLSDWREYIKIYMSNTTENDSSTQIMINTKRGETIAVWQKHGYGYAEECRTPERLANDVGS